MTARLCSTNAGSLPAKKSAGLPPRPGSGSVKKSRSFSTIWMGLVPAIDFAPKRPLASTD